MSDQMAGLLVAAFLLQVVGYCFLIVLVSRSQRQLLDSRGQREPLRDLVNRGEREFHADRGGWCDAEHRADGVVALGSADGVVPGLASDDAVGDRFVHGSDEVHVAVDGDAVDGQAAVHGSPSVGGPGALTPVLTVEPTVGAVPGVNPFGAPGANPAGGAV